MLRQTTQRALDAVKNCALGDDEVSSFEKRLDGFFVKVHSATQAQNKPILVMLIMLITLSFWL